MRVFTRIVIRICDGAVLAADWHAYVGPAALCKSGGSTEIDSVDEAYNAGMLELSQEEWGIAKQYVNLFKYGVDYDPTEVAYVDANGKVYSADEARTQEGMTNPAYTEYQKKLKETMYREESYLDNSTSGPDDPGVMRTRLVPAMSESQAKAQLTAQGIAEPDRYIVAPGALTETTYGAINNYDPNAQVSEMQLMLQSQASAAELLPLQTALQKSQIAADQQLIPAQTGLSLAQISAEQGLVPKRAALESSQISDAQKALAEYAPVRRAFFESALNGPSPEERADQAQAGVEQAFGNTAKDFERQLFTSGIAPGTADMTRALNDRSISKATGIAGARTQAKLLAEDELFNKLKSATAMGTA